MAGTVARLSPDVGIGRRETVAVCKSMSSGEDRALTSLCSSFHMTRWIECIDHVESGLKQLPTLPDSLILTHLGRKG